MSCATFTRIVEKDLSCERGVNAASANDMLDAAVVDYDLATTDEAMLSRAIGSSPSYRVRQLA